MAIIILSNSFFIIGFNFLKSKVKWNGFYGKYTDKGVRKAYKDRVGNVAEINLILTSMLRFAGLNANPVLVSSRGNGIPIFPTTNGFDYGLELHMSNKLNSDAYFSFENELFSGLAYNYNEALRIPLIIDAEFPQPLRFRVFDIQN